MSEITYFLNHKHGLVGEPDYDNHIKLDLAARTFWTPDEPGYLQITSIGMIRHTYIVSAAVAANPENLSGGNLDTFVKNDPKTILVGASSGYAEEWATYDMNLIPIVPGQYIYADNVAHTDSGSDIIFIPFKK
jgi:hypothetical protein